MAASRTRLVALAALLFAAAAYLSASSRPEALPPRDPLAAFPMVIGEWTGMRAPDFDNATLQVLGVDDYVSRIYAFAGEPALSLYVGYYTSQRRGDTIHSPMNCLPGAGWVPVSATHRSIEVAPGQHIDVNHVLIQKGEERQVALYWYQGRGRAVASEYVSKALLVWDAATRHRTDGALVRVISPVRRSETSVAEADARTESFVRAMYPYLREYVPE